MSPVIDGQRPQRRVAEPALALPDHERKEQSGEHGEEAPWGLPGVEDELAHLPIDHCLQGGHSAEGDEGQRAERQHEGRQGALAADCQSDHAQLLDPHRLHRGYAACR